MKTFEEAMQIRNARTREQLKAGMELLQRFESLAEEIGRSKTTLSFVMSFLDMPLPEEMNEESRTLSIMVSIFINGVMVGIEMEKSE